MNKNDTHNRHGLSVVEMMVAIAVLVIVFLGISGVLARNQRHWNTMYNRTYSDVFTDGQIAKKTFDSIIRKSSEDNLLVDSNGTWVQACYYANDDSNQLDRYTLFSCQNGTLSAEHGHYDPNQILSTLTICDNVTDCVFRRSGRSVYMLLTISDGDQTQTIGSSAEMHN